MPNISFHLSSGIIHRLLPFDHVQLDLGHGDHHSASSFQITDIGPKDRSFHPLLEGYAAMALASQALHLIFTFYSRTNWPHFPVVSRPVPHSIPLWCS